MSRYVDEHRGRFGVEPICRTLGVSASAYYQRASGERSTRQVEDERLLGRIRELHAANYYAYGYRRMWKTLLRAGEQVPRCRVQRLMKSHGIQGCEAARQAVAHDQAGPERRPSVRSRPARLHSRTSERALGRRPLLPALLGRLGLLRLRARRVQPDDRRLATAPTSS